MLYHYGFRQLILGTQIRSDFPQFTGRFFNCTAKNVLQPFYLFFIKRLSHG